MESRKRSEKIAIWKNEIKKEMKIQFEKMFEEIQKTIEKKIIEFRNSFIEEMEQKYSILSEKVELLDKKLKKKDDEDNLTCDYFDRRSVLTISGIPGNTDDSNESIIEKISSLVGFEAVPAITCHRFKNLNGTDTSI